jgi:hypothetical protein
MDFVEVRVITGGFKNTNSDIVLVLRTATILIRSGLILDENGFEPLIFFPHNQNLFRLVGIKL